MIRILVADKLSPRAIEKLNEISEFEISEKSGLSPAALKEEIREVEAVVVRSSTRLTREILERADKLKLIIRAGIGLDNIDVAAARSRGIDVRNTPAATSISVAEYTLGLMLAVSRFLVPAAQALKEHRWEKKLYSGGGELFGKRAGIIGFGHIGRELARRLLAMGMEVVIHDSVEIQTDLPVRPVSLKELLRTCDFVCLHVPLSEDTRHLIAERELGWMKKNAVLVNMARGGVVKEEALLAALNQGRLRAALDVFEKEPPDDFTLIAHERVLALPHLGAATEEGQERAGMDVIAILKEFFNV